MGLFHRKSENENAVQQADNIGKKKKNEGGIMDAIRCDQEDYLIWKWRPAGQEANTTNKENAIRYGSSLSVKDGETAVFLYHQKDGTQIDYIEGPYNDTIKTANFPVLARIVGLAFGGATPFQAEVYYINMAGLIQLKFAVPYFDVFDPRFMDLPIPTAVRGSFSFGIADARQFVKLHKLGDFNLEKFGLQIKDALVKYVKGVVIDIPTQYQIPIVRIESKILQVNEIVENYVKPKLEGTFGVSLKTFDISVIEIDKTSEGFIKCKALTTDNTLSQMEIQQRGTRAQMESQQKMTLENAQTANKIQMENMARTNEANLKNMEETLRIQREEGQYAQHLQTGVNLEAQKANIEAGLYGAKLDAEQRNLGAFGLKHQTDMQTQVGVASAEAMGKMGAAGTVNLGNAGGGAGLGGINPGAMMANMMGNAFGQMNQNLGAMQGQAQSAPPLPGAKMYNVAVNGASTGPYSVQQLQTMAQTGQLNAQSLVWCAGMANWMSAGQIPELQGLFASAGNIPPVPPVPPPLS